MAECEMARPGEPRNDSYRQSSMSRGRTMELMMTQLTRPSPFAVQNSNFSSTNKIFDNVCNCERPMRNILCRSCGFLCRGRVQLHCPQHYDVIHLMDIKACPGCKATTLKEFGTVPPKK